MGNSCSQNEITIRKADDTKFVDKDVIISIKNTLAYCFKETRLTLADGGQIKT